MCVFSVFFRLRADGILIGWVFYILKNLIEYILANKEAKKRNGMGKQYVLLVLYGSLSPWPVYAVDSDLPFTCRCQTLATSTGCKIRLEHRIKH